MRFNFFWNLIQTHIVLHTTLMLRWIIVWYLKSIDTRNEINVTSEIWNTYFQTPSPFLKFIRIGRFIYICEVEIDDCVKFLSGLVTMNRQECFKFNGLVCGWQDGNLPRLQKLLYKFRFCKGTLSLKEKHTLILSQLCFFFLAFWHYI